MNVHVDFNWGGIKMFIDDLFEHTWLFWIEVRMTAMDEMLPD